MSTKAAAVRDPDAAAESVRPREVSPDISEVLRLIGAMERLADDVEERHRAVGLPASN
jgi:hypothetical protein